jgi:hypothetical protein
MYHGVRVAALLLLPVSAAQGQDGAQKLYEAMTQKLAKAKAHKFDFEIDGFSGKSAIKWKGTMILAAGNRLKVIFAGQDGKFQVSSTIVSDGQTLAEQDEYDGKPGMRTLDVKEMLVDRVIGHLGPIGAYFGIINILRPQKNAGELKLSGFKTVGKDKVGDRDANVIEYQFPYTSKEFPMTCKLWLDEQTNVPLKRIVEAIEDGQVEFRAVETYSGWELDPKLPEGMFALPK